MTMIDQCASYSGQLVASGSSSVTSRYRSRPRSGFPHCLSLVKKQPVGEPVEQPVEEPVKKTARVRLLIALCEL